MGAPAGASTEEREGTPAVTSAAECCDVAWSFSLLGSLMPGKAHHSHIEAVHKPTQPIQEGCIVYEECVYDGDDMIRQMKISLLQNVITFHRDAHCVFVHTNHPMTRAFVMLASSSEAVWLLANMGLT